MGSKSASAPRAPDPSYVSQQQTQSNINTSIANARLNQVNQVTPQGSLTYKETGGAYDWSGNWIPQFTAETKLSPEQQKLYDTGLQTQQGYADLGKNYVGQVASATSQPFNYDGIPDAARAERIAAPNARPIPTYNDDYQTKVFNQMVDRAQPVWDRARAGLENRLANQGISSGSEASNNAWDDYNRGRNDFLTATELAAGDAATRRYSTELAGQGQDWGQQAQRYGLELQGQGQYYAQSGTDRDRAINDRIRLRQQPINEASGLFGLGGQVQNPNFVNTPQTQIAPTDVSGNYWNAYQGQLAQQQMQNQSNNATMGGLFGLGGTALAGGLRYGLPLLAGSDIRMKDNVRRVGWTDDGQPLYFFTYKSDPNTPHVGLMAQDVEKIRPDAVVEIDGMKYVDYGKALP